MTKICTKCKIEKSLKTFSKDKYTKDGLASACKDCSNKQKKEYYENNKEKIAKKQKEYYEKNKEKSQEYYEQNKEKSQEYRKKNKEKITKKKKKYNKKNKKKIKERYEIIKKMVFNYYGNECICCGENDFNLLTVDHINGGGSEHKRKNKIYNMYNWLIKNNFPSGFQTLCRNCNCGKREYKICPHHLEEFQKIIENNNNKNRGNKSLHKLKIDVIEGYGGKCAHCAEDNPYFLSIDHIFNDGAKERKKISSSILYRKLRRENYPKDRYQLLCYNCNWKKELNKRQNS